MVRSKIDVVIKLFEYTKEGTNYLSKFSWKGSSVKGNIKKRKCRSFTCFLELTRTLTIALGKNLTANTVSEWGLNHFGEWPGVKKIHANHFGVISFIE